MKKSVRIIVSLIVTIVLSALVFYTTLPAINLQSDTFWTFLTCCIVIFGVSYFLVDFLYRKKKNKGAKLDFKLKKSKSVVIFICLLAIPVVVLAVGSLVSSTFFHAEAYSNLIEVPEKNFAEDMPESETINNIALMDTQTAITMGQRALTETGNVSQYTVSDAYRQINYKKAPQKISTLEYADFFKWFSNKETGIPGYVMVDPVVSNSAKYVPLSKPIKYTESGFFEDDLMRKLRFSYPTKIFGNCSFEIDEEGNPYYIVACMKPRIGMFGAYDVNEVIIFDPVSGAHSIYSVTPGAETSDVPAWVDNVFTGELASEKYNWYGTLKNGYWNSVVGNKDCKVTTDDYGYIVIEDDIWFFTGVTSVGIDESNIGFIVSNARTGEYKYYAVSGAEEYSAMQSAEGQVQEKGYDASFPSLVNVAGQPTYIMVLKDNGGLVKLYALVNVDQYAIVATGATQDEAKDEYLKLLKQNGIIDKIPEKAETVDTDSATADIEIAEINVYTVGGEATFYITAVDRQIYKERLCDNESLLLLKKGDKLSVKYTVNPEGTLVRDIISFSQIKEEAPANGEETPANAEPTT
ncbi:MAG: hypothetical protein J6U68_02010 [Clostridia bacterium]|nr:hypothetical protein [Clostridia bacterium]